MDAEFSYPEFPERMESDRLFYKRFGEDAHTVSEISEFMNHLDTEKAYESYPYEPPQSDGEIRDYVEDRKWDRGDDNYMKMYYIYIKDNMSLPFAGTAAGKLEDGVF